MSKKVIWPPPARKSLRRTSYFISELWNEQVNEAFLDQLEYRIGQLQLDTELGSAFEKTNF